MSTDIVTKYIDLQSAFNKERYKYRKLVKTIGNAYEGLKANPLECSVAGLPCSNMLLGVSPRNLMSPEDWPSAQDINNALEALRQKRVELENAWNSIPKDEREMLKEPDTQV